MTACTLAPARLLLLGVFALACTKEDRSPPLGPSFSLDADPTLTGAVLGPDGSNVCNTLDPLLGPSARMVVRPINPATGSFAGFQPLFCDANAFSFSLAPGNYLLRTQLPPDPAIGTLPWRNLESEIVIDGDITRDAHVRDGTVLGGRVTLDGNPVEGVGLSVVYDQAPGFGATSGSSGPDGTWSEFFGRSLVLQNDVRYRVGSGCPALGVKVLEAPPTSGFLFPGEVSAVNCALTTAPATQFSHTLTRLVVTPLPGDVGGLSPELFDQYGSGWGVQFPVAPGTSPARFPFEASHMFLGGLIIGMAPDHVLTGTTTAGEMECREPCRDLGLDATLGFTDQTPAGRTVLWQYSDAGSADGVGLRIRQRSFDGVPPNDYVLFRFSIQNQGSSTVTFYAGFWADWDVDLDPFDDVGFTEMDGRLMYEASSDEAGTHIGTVLRGDAPVSGNFFFVNETPVPSLTDQVQALSGGLRRETAGPGDLRYIHGIGPIALARGKKSDLWVAIVAGENHDQLLANAAAADADIGKRQRQSGEVSDASHTVSTQPLGVPGRPFSKSQKPQ